MKTNIFKGREFHEKGYRICFLHSGKRGEEEPTMFIARLDHIARAKIAVGIPLSMLYTLVDTNSLILKCMEYANRLHGKGMWIKADVHNLADIILNHVDDLAMMPPAAMPTKNEIENMMADHGLVLKADGQTLIDAAH